MKSNPTQNSFSLKIKLLLGTFTILLANYFVGATTAINQSAKLKPSKSSVAILAVLDAQAEAWNRGDLEGYMAGYDRSPATEFVGGDTITRGWQTVLERYQKKYDSREKMGVLTYSEIEITLPIPGR